MAKLNKGLLVKTAGLVLTGVVVFLLSTTAQLYRRGQLNRQGLSALRKLPVVGRLVPPAQPQAPKPSALTRSQSVPTAKISKLLAQANELRDGLQAKKEELDARERRLASLEKDLDQKRQDIEKVKRAVDKGWQELKKAKAELERDKVVFRDVETRNIKKMAKVYDKMKPDKAAQGLKNVDEDTAVKLLSVMTERTAAKVLEAMEPTDAGKISEKLRRLRHEPKSGSTPSTPSSLRPQS